MKLVCDLCGGMLQVNSGGHGATCTTCGLTHSMERLREILAGNAPVMEEPIEDEIVAEEIQVEPDGEEIIYDAVVEWLSVETTTTKPSFDFVPSQFVMENNGIGIRNLSGYVLQGGIGLGDDIYIDGDYSKPYRVCTINDDAHMTCAKEGMDTKLFLVNCPKKVLKNARMVTGNPNPVANAYNYPGTVREYFANVLASELSQYEIRENVAHDDLKIPVNYLFCQSGKPVLAVMLVDSNDNRARYQVKKAAKIFATEGVACTHFFENYRNDMPYVIDRVRSALC